MTYENDGSITTERANFIMKVYGLLTLSLLVSVGGSIFGANCISTHGELFRSGAMRWGGILVLIATLMLRKVRGLNLALLFGFTFFEGAFLGPYMHLLAMHGHRTDIWQAAIITLGTFGALTGYVFWSKKDFSYLGGFLWAGLIGLILVGFMNMFVAMSSGMSLLFSYAGVLIFIGYILFDTSRIILRLPTDEYVSATLELYLDLVNLFLYILRIIGGRSSRN